MNSLADIITPIDRSDKRRTAIEVYDTLQSLILSGQLQPGAIISQVAIARALEVSRTPVREAMRMLQEGGLVAGEPNFRCKVVGFDPNDIEALYSKRIALEALGAALTARHIAEADIAALGRLVAELESEAAHDSFDLWQKLHRKFHRTIVSAVGPTMAADLEQLEGRSERYQSAYKGAHLPGWWLRGEAEHRELHSAISQRNSALAGELAARHLARTALELLAALAPEFDSGRIRAALCFAIEGVKAV